MHPVTMQAFGKTTARFHHETNAGPGAHTNRTKIHALVISSKIRYWGIEITVVWGQDRQKNKYRKRIFEEKHFS
jgi:hypothetical protein